MRRRGIRWFDKAPERGFPELSEGYFYHACHLVSHVCVPYTIFYQRKASLHLTEGLVFLDDRNVQEDSHWKQVSATCIPA